jgi:hypothetical protein
MFKRRICKNSSNSAGLKMLLQYQKKVIDSANSGILLACLPAERILFLVLISDIEPGGNLNIEVDDLLELREAAIHCVRPAAASWYETAAHKRTFVLHFQSLFKHRSPPAC